MSLGDRLESPCLYSIDAMALRSPYTDRRPLFTRLYFLSGRHASTDWNLVDTNLYFENFSVIIVYYTTTLYTLRSLLHLQPVLACQHAPICRSCSIMACQTDLKREALGQLTVEALSPSL